MPVYYFSLSDRIVIQPDLDPPVEELPNDAAAKIHARQVEAELGNHATEWPHVRVFDSAGQRVT